MRRNIDTWFNALLFLSLSLLHHSSLCSAGPVFAEASVLGSNFLTMNQISLEAASHSFLQVEQKEGAGSVPRDDCRGTVHLPFLRGLASSGLRCCLRQEFLQATKHLNASFQIPFEAVVIWGGWNRKPTVLFPSSLAFPAQVSMDIVAGALAHCSFSNLFLLFSLFCIFLHLSPPAPLLPCSFLLHYLTSGAPHPPTSAPLAQSLPEMPQQGPQNLVEKADLQNPCHIQLTPVLFVHQLDKLARKCGVWSKRVHLALLTLHK